MCLCRSFFYSLLFLSGFLSLDVAVGEGLDRTVAKLAAEMLRECPELQGGESSSEARKRLVAEFEGYDAHSISSTYLKKIKRSKADYADFTWSQLVEKYECAHFKCPKMVFLYKKAKAQKMRSDELYVVTKLMAEYYDLKVEERALSSRRDLRLLGKLYTAYVKEKGAPPETLAQLQPEACKQHGINPFTGAESQWGYIGQGPSEIRGSNRYRVVAYANFSDKRGGEYCWVVYKGGLIGTWKTKSLRSALQKMERDNKSLRELAEKEKSRKEADEVKVVAQADVKPAKAKLKISIKELW